MHLRFVTDPLIATTLLSCPPWLPMFSPFWHIFFALVNQSILHSIISHYSKWSYKKAEGSHIKLGPFVMSSEVCCLRIMWMSSKIVILLHYADSWFLSSNSKQLQKWTVDFEKHVFYMPKSFALQLFSEHDSIGPFIALVSPNWDKTPARYCRFLSRFFSLLAVDMERPILEGSSKSKMPKKQYKNSCTKGDNEVWLSLSTTTIETLFISSFLNTKRKFDVQNGE